MNRIKALAIAAVVCVVAIVAIALSSECTCTADAGNVTEIIVEEITPTDLPEAGE